MHGLIKDIVGQTFAKLTVLQYHSSSSNGAVWICKCECGNTCLATGSHMKRKSTKSCGCLPKGIKYESN